MTATATPAKLKSGAWGARVRGTAARGDTITITTAAGKRWTAVVTAIVWQGEGVTLVATGSAGSTDSTGRSIRSGASYRAGITAPRGRTCPMCGSRECARAWNPRDLCDED